jgi:formyltetrahydrofolate synthetase
MNERIKELAEQSGAGWDDKYHWYVGSETMEKFAELMIKEFETVAKNPRWYFPEQQDGWRDPINCVCKEMKKHFGVE